jgi:two-component system, NtrC family, sensor kinase
MAIARWSILSFYMCISFLASTPGINAQILSIDTIQFTGESRQIGTYLYICTSSDKSINDPSFLFNSCSFEQSQKEIISLQYLKKDIWIYFAINNQSNSESFILELDNPQLDSVILFEHQNENHFEIIATGGDWVQNNQSKSKFKPVFELNLKPNQSSTYVLKINGLESMVLPIKIAQNENNIKQNLTRHLVFTCYIGIMLVMFLYNSFLYVTIRERAYLYYVMYIFSISFAQAALGNYLKVLLGIENIWWHQFNITLFSTLSGIFAIIFASSFLELKKNAPIINYGLMIFGAAYPIAFLIYLFGFPFITYHIFDFAGLFVSIYALGFSIYLSLKKQRTAIFFLIAWVFFIIGLIAYVGKNLGLFPSNLFTDHGIHFGSGIEAVLLSIALADKINILKKDKEKAQARELELSMKNEQIVRDQNIELEKQVNVRTAELQQVNHELTDTNTRLKETQLQLVESEKMASLGQLTAGVAHEINNPINFVSSNIKPLRRDIKDIINLIDSLEAEVPDEIKLKIAAYKSNIEYDVVLEEIDLLLKGIEEGANRTVDIVKGLKNFSRLDEHEFKVADIIEGIESTFILLNSNLGNTIKVTKNYQPIPEIECYPGKLNQVFMNILSNSIYAIRKQFGNNAGGHIKIETLLQDQMIRISIEDNGVGISSDKISKIFDPFFTTKDVGEGTGLGLSIVYNIINMHQGKIHVESDHGIYTRFLISLPLKMNHETT